MLTGLFLTVNLPSLFFNSATKSCSRLNNIKYTNELKNNFKINEENFNISALESFQRDIDTKIKSFQIY